MDSLSEFDEWWDKQRCKGGSITMSELRFIAAKAWEAAKDKKCQECNKESTKRSPALLFSVRCNDKLWGLIKKGGVNYVFVLGRF